MILLPERRIVSPQFQRLVSDGTVKIIKEGPQPVLTKAVLEKMADTIPQLLRIDPANPEWPPTPVRMVVIVHQGSRFRLPIKDESANRHGVVKSRPAFEYVKLWKNWACKTYMDLKRDGGFSAVASVPIPYESILTYGNMGMALAGQHTDHEVPFRPKLLVPTMIPAKTLNALQSCDADIYMRDMDGTALSAMDILLSTDNAMGLEVTSERILVRTTKLYDWHVHETFNEAVRRGCTHVFVPFGSGDLFNSYLRWQRIVAERQQSGMPQDPRLVADAESVLNLSIIGVGLPAEVNDGNKLSSKYLPYKIYCEEDAKNAVRYGFSGPDSRIVNTTRERMEQVHSYLLQAGMDICPDAGAGVAGYLDMIDNGGLPKECTPFFVSTGKGI